MMVQQSSKSKTHAFGVDDAIKHGLECATLMHSLRYYLDKCLAERKNVIDGYVWTHKTAKSLVEVFPYWTEKKIQRLLKKLVDAGALKVECLHENPFDRGRWYTMPEYKIELSDCSESEIPDCTNVSNGNQSDVSDCFCSSSNIDECTKDRFGECTKDNFGECSLLDLKEDLKEDLNSSILSSPRVEQVTFSFDEIFWPAWKYRKHNRKECFDLYAKALAESGEEPSEFAKRLVSDLERREKINPAKYRRMHPKTFLSATEWQNEPVKSGFDNAASPDEKKLKKLKSEASAVWSKISGEQSYLNSVRIDDPLRDKLVKSAETRIQVLTAEHEQLQQEIALLSA